MSTEMEIAIAALVIGVMALFMPVLLAVAGR